MSKVTKALRDIFLCGQTNIDKNIDCDGEYSFNSRNSSIQNDYDISINKQIYKTLENEGYTIIRRISNTLQGCIFIAKYNKDNKKVIIKLGNKHMCKNGYTTIDGKMVKISENIKKEASIMKYLTHSSKNYPNHVLRFIKSKRFFSDINCYYLIQQYGGIDMFTFALDKHAMIRNNETLIEHWKNSVKKYFCEIVNTLYWFHDVMSMCHLDISLENMVYNAFKDRVYICDFGLSQVFKNSDTRNSDTQDGNLFLCDKYVGKYNYQCPKMVHKMPYDATKADVWALGVSLFLMNFGMQPFRSASVHDPYYCNFMNGYLKLMIKDYGMESYLDESLHDLLYKIFTSEEQRYKIKDIMKHEYTKGYEFSEFH